MRRRNGRADEYETRGIKGRDLSLQSVRAELIAKIKEKKARGAHFSPDCTTWSVLQKQRRSMQQPNGIDGLSPEDQAKLDVANSHKDFVVDACTEATKANVSWSVEFPSFRGDKSLCEGQVFWEEKSTYPTIVHDERFANLIKTSNAKIITYAGCLTGGDYQKFTSMAVWPAQAAAPFDNLDGVPCPHATHAKKGRRRSEPMRQPRKNTRQSAVADSLI